MSSLPPTPLITRPTTFVSSATSLLPLPSSGSSSNVLANTSTTTSIVLVADGPNDVVVPGGTTLDPPGMIMTSASMAGMFGAGANLDPLIIFALVVGVLLLLLLVGALIYCCCVCCGGPAAQHHRRPIERTSSVRSIRIIEEPCPPQPTVRPLFLRASVGPDCPTCGAEPAATVRLDQSVRVNVGAYSFDDGTSGTLGAYPKRMMVQPDVIVTRRSNPVHQTAMRKKYLYPIDSIGVANGRSYNAVTTQNVITTLGDGYVTGGRRSIRTTGSRYGNDNFLFYDD